MPDHVLAVAYPNEAAAEEALATVQGLAAARALVLKDAAVVVREADGRVDLRQTRDDLAVGEGMVGGGSLGLLVGLLFGVPVAGALIGVAGGVGLGAYDRGIPDDRMRKLGDELRPGHAALFVLVADADLALVEERLEPYGGELVASEVDGEVVAALGAAAARSTVP